MEEKISEGEILESETREALEKKPKKRVDIYVELALFLVLGILMGIAIKTEASKKLTIGFDDYKMNILPKGYDINQLQKEEIQKQIEESQKQAESEGQTFENNAEGVSGGSCQ
ncbi:MAG: hypothetical protein ACOYS2_00345 [Patescibacteria group bacterium]